VPGQQFEAAKFVPGSLYSRITDLRIKQPGLAARLLAERRKRRLVAKDGKLALIAADHPARMMTGIRDDPLPLAMAVDSIIHEGLGAYDAMGRMKELERIWTFSVPTIKIAHWGRHGDAVGAPGRGTVRR